MIRRMVVHPVHVPGKRSRGRQQTRWKDSCKRDMEIVVLNAEGVLGQDKVEERNSKPLLQPQMMGKD